MTTLQIVSVTGEGFALGAILGSFCMWRHLTKVFRNHAKAQEESNQVVDENTLIRCGACRSLVRSQPIFVSVAQPDSFRAYRCEQCGTQVSVKI